MPYSISTLLTRNLHDVFGENDPARRRAAVDEIFTEDGRTHTVICSRHDATGLADAVDRSVPVTQCALPDLPV